MACVRIASQLIYKKKANCWSRGRLGSETSWKCLLLADSGEGLSRLRPKLYADACSARSLSRDQSRLAQHSAERLCRFGKFFLNSHLRLSLR